MTFDDAYGNIYTQAWPVLRQLGIPATIFLATAYLDSDEPFPFDPWGVAYRDRVPAETYRPLRTAECLEMAASGLIEIGSHTHTHQDFRGRADAFRADVAQSIEILRDRFAIEQVLFCFPWGTTHNGFAGGDLAQSAEEAGAICGVTADPGVVNHLDSPFRWGRFNVFDWDTAATLGGKLSGWYLWPSVLQMLRSRARNEPRIRADVGAARSVMQESSP